MRRGSVAGLLPAGLSMGMIIIIMPLCSLNPSSGNIKDTSAILESRCCGKTRDHAVHFFA
ncbi:MAG: hypothetical protein B7X81_08205 [Hydrogenophilales bacterium 17-61-76]|nr:MAG: hypothetical protein B7Y21_04495 [Hydrogenophilales bacterium 16-61-112]OZA45536.1 MAG: hypothetical protein B7X81_08205 [Hydrogenophilales bacterium 17-61-76]